MNFNRGYQGAPLGRRGIPPGRASVGNAQTYDPSSYTDYLRGVAQGTVNPGNGIEDGLQNYSDQARQQQQEDLITNMLTGVAQVNANRNNMPAVNMDQQKGFQGLHNPANVGQPTQLPAPFNHELEKTKNLMGIMNSYDPALYNASEDVIQQANAMAPRAAYALQHKGSIFEGVPRNFFVNRMNLALQRKRENDMYAFA